MKTDPAQFLKEEESYLQNFWNPRKGNQVVYIDGNTYTIKKILEDQVVLVELPDRAIWIQDLGWKPSLEDCDEIAAKFSAQIVGNQILFKTTEQRCFFERPNSVSEYRDIIRQLRVLNKFKEVD
jgi:hypothetical protein